MISLQASKQILSDESISKKRKLDDPDEKPTDTDIRRNEPVSDVHLRSHTQFASEWQRCLDIKSGQIYYCNTRTNKRVLGDSSLSLEQYSPAAPMSLELELNLPSRSSGGIQGEESCGRHDYGTASLHPDSRVMTSNTVRDEKGLLRAPSWLTFEDEQQEMVTAVCKKCYMLVMMCKSSPSCPNCKFVHPTEAALTSSIKG